MSNQSIEVYTSEAIRRGDKLLGEIRYEDFFRGELRLRFPECDATGIVDRFRLRGEIEFVRIKQILKAMLPEVLPLLPK